MALSKEAAFLAGAVAFEYCKETDSIPIPIGTGLLELGTCVCKGRRLAVIYGIRNERIGMKCMKSQQVPWCG
ncbi:hypothetical protein B5K10_23310 [Rhizobium leguminosarum bv. trifolii]|uniref:Uncharacterized protein n=1 Tax=Rhizobium leguminosarum bv. trifolii TaxID=386 RepID=A0A3E1B7J8_RHILT|nr:hypothetical protein B5K10_23310 [Rhizobium leguminosarum bv. trifolii]